jgi:glycosyltransferase involved in cell wall biosynthesis
MPNVSVLFPVYNAINDLPKSLSSLFNQSFRDFEVIAIDDGSTDGSGELLDRYAASDARLRVFHQENAGALGLVLNRAAGLAEGKYLARQDADDASQAFRFENQVNYLEAHPETGLCGTWAWFVDGSLGPLFSLELPDDVKRLGAFLNNGMNPFVHGSVMLRANDFQKMGGYRGSYAEDYDLWLRISEKKRIGMCTTLGYYYWRTVGGISAGAHIRQKALIKLILKLHFERLNLGGEITRWADEYQAIVDMPVNESNLDERQTSMHYARGLQLLRRRRFEAARSEFEKAAFGHGQYAIKARRNLSFIGLAPVLAAFYGLLKRQEPEQYARTLPIGTSLPNF